jgi:putative endonuclease
MFCVYAIQSYLNGRIYIGQTQDISIRLADHNAGRVVSNRQHRPWWLIKCVPCDTREAARWLEHELKSSRGRRLKWLSE